MDVSKFVHYHKKSGRWVVAQYKGGRYYAPIRTFLRKRVGASTVFGSLDYVMDLAYHYKNRRDALRRARELFDY